MARTTINIDDPLLEEVKKIQRDEGGSLGAVVTRLLADAVARRKYDDGAEPTPFRWNTRVMKARIDLKDKSEVYAALDAERG